MERRKKNGGMNAAKEEAVLFVSSCFLLFVWK